jgi:hypothetical protein
MINGTTTLAPPTRRSRVPPTPARRQRDPRQHGVCTTTAFASTDPCSTTGTARATAFRRPHRPDQRPHPGDLRPARSTSPTFAPSTAAGGPLHPRHGRAPTAGQAGAVRSTGTTSFQRLTFTFTPVPVPRRLALRFRLGLSAWPAASSPPEPTTGIEANTSCVSRPLSAS